MRYLVRTRLLGIGDDYWIEDEHGRRAYLVDGKALMRLRQTFQLRDHDGTVVAVIRRKVLSLWQAMTVERNGRLLATVRKKRFTLLRNRFRVILAGDGEMAVHGDVIDKEYEITHKGVRVARISRRWFHVRDTYAVDVEDPERTDVPLMLSIAVCVQALSEGRD